MSTSFQRPTIVIGDRLPNPIGHGEVTVVGLEQWQDRWPWVIVQFERDDKPGVCRTGWPAFQHLLPQDQADA